MLIRKVKYKRGFTLVESIISFALLVTTLLSMGLVMVSALKLQRDQRQALTAQTIAQEIFNKEILNRPFTGTTGSLMNTYGAGTVTTGATDTNGDNCTGCTSTPLYLITTPTTSDIAVTNITANQSDTLKKLPKDAKIFVKVRPIKATNITYFTIPSTTIPSKLFASVIVTWGDPIKAARASSIITYGGAFSKGF